MVVERSGDLFLEGDISVRGRERERAFGIGEGDLREAWRRGRFTYREDLEGRDRRRLFAI